VDFIVFVGEQWLLVSLLAVLVTLFFWTERSRAGVPLSAHEVTRLLNLEQALLLDVRDAAEFKVGHIAGAYNIPHGKIQERFTELEKSRDKIIVVTDKVGQHAGQVGKFLKEKEFRVHRLQGGMGEWLNLNLPVVTGS